MSKCDQCGKHDGSWYNNRNSDIYCSKCVGDVNFYELQKMIKDRIEWLIDDNIVDNAEVIQEFRTILKQSETIEASHHEQ